MFSKRHKRKKKQEEDEKDSHERESPKSVQIAIPTSLTEARIVKSCQVSAGTLRTTTPADTCTILNNFQRKMRHVTGNDQQCSLKGTNAKRKHSA
jgi:uncharacterized alpha-E superfamily protein